MNNITQEEATKVMLDYFHAKDEVTKVCNEMVEDIEECIDKICDHIRKSDIGSTAIDEGLKKIRDNIRDEKIHHRLDARDAYDTLVFVKHIMKLYIEE